MFLLALLLASCGNEATEGFPVPSWAKVAPEQIAEAKKHGVPVAFENDIGMRFVLIPAGTFLMGSPEGEEGSPVWANETQREVTIPLPYYIQITETTNRQFRAYRPDHSSGSIRETKSLDGDSQPVVQVTPDDAVEFAAWVSRRDTGRAYRLPTEEEWERAARAGSASKYYWGNRDEDAHMYANGRDPKAGSLYPPGWTATKFPVNDGFAVTAPVGSFLPNAYGLYDVLGNVHDYCTAATPPGAAVRYFGRGGAHGSGPKACRLGVRSEWESDLGLVRDCGFRLVSPLP